MGIISWIVVGGLAGWIASIVMGNNASQGLLGNIIVGVIGAFIGGWVIGFFNGNPNMTGINLGSIAVATLGAIILLAIKQKLL